MLTPLEAPPSVLTCQSSGESLELTGEGCLLKSIWAQDVSRFLAVTPLKDKWNFGDPAQWRVG
jgi:hypothetical protein